MTPSQIAEVLLAHQMTTVQAVKPFRTLWRCSCGHEVEAQAMRHAVAQAKHQAKALNAAFRKEQRART